MQLRLQHRSILPPSDQSEAPKKHWLRSRAFLSEEKHTTASCPTEGSIPARRLQRRLSPCSASSAGPPFFPPSPAASARPAVKARGSLPFPVLVGLFARVGEGGEMLKQRIMQSHPRPKQLLSRSGASAASDTAFPVPSGNPHGCRWRGRLWQRLRLTQRVVGACRGCSVVYQGGCMPKNLQP